MGKKSESPGTVFEGEIAAMCLAYQDAGIASLEKVDPPIRVLHIPGGGKRVVFLANPFLDFSGTWTARGGKAIHIECKATSPPILNIKSGTSRGGITESQLIASERWEAAGAAVAFLWRHEAKTRILTPAMVRAQLATRNSLRWCDAHDIPQGSGFLFIDFLAVLARLNPPAT